MEGGEKSKKEQCINEKENDIINARGRKGRE
jgi:hypothetical protein